MINGDFRVATVLLKAMINTGILTTSMDHLKDIMDNSQACNINNQECHHKATMWTTEEVQAQEKDAVLPFWVHWLAVAA